MGEGGRRFEVVVEKYALCAEVVRHRGEKFVKGRMGFVRVT